jgi:hypothetical protein
LLKTGRKKKTNKQTKTGEEWKYIPALGLINQDDKPIISGPFIQA